LLLGEVETLSKRFYTVCSHIIFIAIAINISQAHKPSHPGVINHRHSVADTTEPVSLAS
jgi:hypothetical protein